MSVSFRFCTSVSFVCLFFLSVLSCVQFQQYHSVSTRDGMGGVVVPSVPASTGGGKAKAKVTSPYLPTGDSYSLSHPADLAFHHRDLFMRQPSEKYLGCPVAVPRIDGWPHHQSPASLYLPLSLFSRAFSLSSVCLSEHVVVRRTVSF
jgi:hypothetical protein